MAKKKTIGPIAMAERPKPVRKIVIDPVTRIEGHLKIEVDVKDGQVVDARSTGALFRGFEMILKDRDPRDASQITQRICGVCPTSHASASVRTLDAAFGVKPPTNGRLLRNIILASDYAWDHPLHFYHLAALDYVKGPSTEPFIPRYEGDYRLDEKTNQVAVNQYLEALKIKEIGHQLTAIWGGKGPIVQGMVVGGATAIPTKEEIATYKDRAKKVVDFINNTYLPTVYLVAGVYADLFNVGVGCKNLLSYGVFPLDDNDQNFLLKPGSYTEGQDYPLDVGEIEEFVSHSYYDDMTTGKNPAVGETVPLPGKKGAYSYIKAARYRGVTHEVGPLARMWITNPVLSKHANKFLGVDASKDIRMRDLGDKAFSVLGRHAARAEEGYLVAKALVQWLDELIPGESAVTMTAVPQTGQGIGLSEAPRGSVGHWIKIENAKIAKYQIIAPTTWNASPCDDKGRRGPIEEALIGTPVPDPENPFNVVRVIRSFDP